MNELPPFGHDYDGIRPFGGIVGPFAIINALLADYHFGIGRGNGIVGTKMCAGI